MARKRRFDEDDLYEGNGEVISFGSNHRDEWKHDRTVNALPGRKPLGRDAGLRARDDYDRKAEEAAYVARERYFRYDGEPEREKTTVFDEFGAYTLSDPSMESRPVYKRTTKHKGLWISVIVMCLTILIGMALLVLPQLTGVRYRFLPNLAFVNGSLVELNEDRYTGFRTNADYLYSDRIYRGVFIDGINVGGMTAQEAVSALNDTAEQPVDSFDLTVCVGNGVWHVTSNTVKISKNVGEMVEKALSLGRGNTAEIHNSGTTPIKERMNKASELIAYPVYMETRKTFDRQALMNEVQTIVSAVNREPVNSMVTAFDFGTQTFSFSEDQPGAYLDPEELFGKLADRLEAKDYTAVVTLVPEKRLADMTRTELMNSFRKISGYTTKTTSNKNRNTNIRLSAEAINGTTVLPGEIFSFNAATGERTAQKGYKEAAAISGGQSRDEVGGGVCQTSSTLFNAVARADLEIITRSPHAWPSSYVEKGMDATVDWPALDFKFKNNTEQPVFIVASYENQKVSVELYGMSLGNDVTIDLESNVTEVIPQPEGTNYVINTNLKLGESKKTITGRKGYKVETYKVWYQAGKEIKRELLCKSTYKAYQETIEYNPR